MAAGRLLALAPAALSVVAGALLLVPYAVGVRRGELVPLLPTVSQAASCPSTAALATALLCLHALVGAICSAAVGRLLAARGEPAWTGRLVVLLGLVSAAATALVGLTPVARRRTLHFAGVAVAIGSWSASAALLTALTPRWQPRLRRLRRCLLALTAGLAVSALTNSSLEPDGHAANMQLMDSACNVTEAARLGWRPGSWRLHSLAAFAVCEWALLVVQAVFVASFVGELWHRLGAPAGVYAPVVVAASAGHQPPDWPKTALFIADDM
ncbi:DNA damage-regulated autophagy modulator protein 1-like [Amphibalanus amphitrite]|uniref:DNA damage-regulated autophagy modulator protein 1-like n=1 Tax=Amphibalanus amphitrite TaxID=1232801 RepID=UPI001C90CD80|nr:DNA damage-regulated autophagy modulator protein 1-like [Amphibalanus amphitrite]XP_043203872.1 DNA damage-regulated autophagy modulator protein 1-like [Amphibalanus amphitrite]